MKKTTFTQLLAASDFRQLFITEMGWNKPTGQARLPQLTIDERDYDITVVAQRNGFQILTASVNEIPTQSACKKLDGKLRRQANDYILILTIPGSQHQCWVCPVKQAEKRETVLVEYADFTQVDFLYAKLVGLEFAYDELTTIIDVRERVQHAFAVNSEKITKDFYTGFRKEHKAFSNFIEGIDADKDRQWYTSVMLNRLMFCYFIQKKGFLNGDADYLPNKLRKVRQEEGAGKFYRSFYLDFLVSLFHDGLNSPRHTPEWEQRYGRIPYLNGGMFDIHQLEQLYEGIDIPDEAFERLFEFFDKWQWHLDTRITATGKDINPDVLGYIFEQYINDRSAMGAYYTKEDITEYISKNCILPYLFDRVEESTSRDCFKPTGYVWRTLRESGDRYIYDAVKKGYTDDWAQLIPDNIAVGLSTTEPDLLERRRDWNTPTAEPFALPTEIWRETVERLRRCEDVKQKIADGHIVAINDFITYNLNIRLFAEDLLARTSDHRFVANFYHALQRVTILDPTCGSGAFLFAAMGILEPLYETCIQRMEEFHAENDKLFVAELDEIRRKYRSNIQYFIYKSIILRNLYGVDIMVEATEIAKLRLFLKMVAVVEVDRRADNMGLDPLPDIDFNIRCGNTLVGYATERELMDSVVYSGDMFAVAAFRDKVEQEMQIVATAYSTFKQLQMVQDDDMAAFKQAKQQLRERLAALNDMINHHMYGTNISGSYDDWLASHQPFHWLAEFYDIIKGHGGFDVIIGNPPYVGYTRANKQSGVSVSELYSIGKGYKTLPTSNLYAFTIERSDNLKHNKARIGMIIPISAFANNSMKELQILFKQNYGRLWISTFHQRPAQLFDGVLQRLSIFLGTANGDSQIFTTGIYRWYSHTRDFLFMNLSYTSTNQLLQPHMIKIGSSLEGDIFSKYASHKKLTCYLTSYQTQDNSIYYRTAGGGYWVTFLNREFDCVAISNKSTSISKDFDSTVFTAALNSNLFWWYYSINFDLFNFKDYMIFGFQINYPKSLIDSLSELSEQLEQSLRNNAVFYEIKSKTRGVNKTVTYQKILSKPIMDEIDKVLAKHYGFTDEELDFIINYDIKYRMGDELNAEE